MTLYMVVEHFRDGDAVPVYRRFRDHGRLAPAGLTYVTSWVDDEMRTCFQVMEAERSRPARRVDRGLGRPRRVRGLPGDDLGRGRRADRALALSRDHRPRPARTGDPQRDGPDRKRDENERDERRVRAGRVVGGRARVDRERATDRVRDREQPEDRPEVGATEDIAERRRADRDRRAGAETVDRDPERRRAVGFEATSPMAAMTPPPTITAATSPTTRRPNRSDSQPPRTWPAT